MDFYRTLRETQRSPNASGNSVCLDARLEIDSVIPFSHLNRELLATRYHANESIQYESDANVDCPLDTLLTMCFLSSSYLI
jgi:hypothetical protein